MLFHRISMQLFHILSWQQYPQERENNANIPHVLIAAIFEITQDTLREYKPFTLTCFY